MLKDYWKFKELNILEIEDDPRVAEFFKNVEKEEGIIREFIQNSIDARKDSNSKITIKITYLKTNFEKLSQFITQDLIEHVKAAKNEAKQELRLGKIVDLLILEDFGTTGLLGPIDKKSRCGDFYNFWWRQGRSQKEGQKAGRWGLGKSTFNMASKIRTIFGLTIRSDKIPLLMGRTLLIPHKLHGKIFDYYGSFVEDNGYPIRDYQIIKNFKETFGLKRNNEDGLSVAIPILEFKFNENIFYKYIIYHYFYPILNGILEIELYFDNFEIKIDKSSLIEIAKKINWSGTEWEDVNIEKTFEIIKEIKSTEPIEISLDDLEYNEHSDQGNTNIDLARERFNRYEPVRLRIPVRIEYFQDSFRDSFFEIFLQKTHYLNRPFEYYVRSGISIPKVRKLKNSSLPIIAIFVAEEDFICEFLGDSEGPSHLTWNKNTDGFKEKYKNGDRLINSIKESVRSAVKLFEKRENTILEDLLKDIFYWEVSDKELEKDSENNNGIKVTVDKPKINFETKPQEFNVIKTKLGFYINLNMHYKGKIRVPFEIKVRVAYATIMGDPFSKYQVYDFDLSKDDIKIDVDGGSLINKYENVAYFIISTENFKVNFEGFDTSRDIAVEVVRIEKDT